MPVISESKSEIDMLENQLSNAINDTSKVILLNKIAKKYRDIDVDKGLKYAHTALELSSKLDYIPGKAESYKNIGLNYWRMGSYDIAIENDLKALALFEEINDIQGIATTNNNIGLIYLARSRFSKAIDFLLASIKYSSRINDQIGISRSMLNIAIVYSEQKEYTKALDYHFKSLKICIPQKDSILIGTNYCFLGRTYINLKQFDSAYKNLTLGLDIFNKINSMYDIAATNNQIALYYNKTQNFKKSLEYSNIGYKLGLKNQNKYLQMEALGLISESYYGLKQFENAYQYNLKYRNLQDSMTNEDNIRNIAQKEVEYVYDKKLKTLEINQKNELYKKSFLLYSSIILSIFLVIVVLIIYFLYKGKTNANILLSIKNKEIENQKNELNSLNLELQKSNSAKDKFFSIIAHDLKSPFSGFIGISQVLAEELDQLSIKEIQEYAVLLKNSAVDLYKLLENLLEWSRIQQGLIGFNPEMSNIHSIVNSIIDFQKSNAANKNINIINTIPSKLDLICDANMINTVFRNIISNSLKFTENGGFIKIGIIVEAQEMQPSSDYITFYVKDTGIGIPATFIPLLFKVGEKTSRVGTNGESSTGLGLILCKEYIQKHKGKIWVESEEGKGSTFYFTLPKLSKYQ
jgi:signal transduction histidine kinase